MAMRLVACIAREYHVIAEKEKEETVGLWRMTVRLFCFLFFALEYTHTYIEAQLFTHSHAEICTHRHTYACHSTTNTKLSNNADRCPLKSSSFTVGDWTKNRISIYDWCLTCRGRETQHYILNMVINVITIQRIKVEDGGHTALYQQCNFIQGL